jgi:hypothetical protein
MGTEIVILRMHGQSRSYHYKACLRTPSIISEKTIFPLAERLLYWGSDGEARENAFDKLVVCKFAKDSLSRIRTAHTSVTRNSLISIGPEVSVSVLLNALKSRIVTYAC